ncbi:hypothetical protein POX_b02183 [Penicillium oxalicum]|uniref:hypothetical protein n=1 Tax=Penicillium oxalicum TaxID=69781 RepID=UPI0020B6D9A7|nr:hypothetical protein POX_b02183 [Penicillium oxalicum]KAI2792147.1 hypothetical protein POX_b02183 [Penicillium oxalicum]
MDSPPKRRRTGEVLELPIGASQTLIPRRESRSPGRTSFQSPTRASLAKSHPEILERAISRSPSKQSPIRPSPEKQISQDDPRSLGIRGRKAFRPSLNPSSPLKAPRASGSPMVLSPSRRASNIQAFSKPPRRLSRKISAADFVFGSPVRKPIRPTHDLSNTPEEQLALDLDAAIQEEVAGADLGFDDGSAGTTHEDDSLEPDLPPTPAQLGLEKAPARSKGLLSSSPSSRQERRKKRAATDFLHGGSTKALRSQSSQEEASEDSATLTRTSATAAVVGKRKTRKGLEAELRRLKAEVADMSKWTEKVDSGLTLSTESDEVRKLLNLLKEESTHINQPIPQRDPIPVSALLRTLLPFGAKLPRPAPSEIPMPTNPFALKEISKSAGYLTFFAPLTLRATTSRTASKAVSLLETHTLNFTAPSPFPSSLYNVSVVYETNPETQNITSVSVPTGGDSRKRKVPTALRQWIDTRLENPLLALDVATLCWGINRYWEASVTRARLWARIDASHGAGSIEQANRNPPGDKEGVITAAELRTLVPHLERSTMVIKQAVTDSQGPRVLLSNALVIDEWTGEPQLESAITVSTPNTTADLNKRIDRETRKLFHALLREEGAVSIRGKTARGLHADAIFRATEGALGALRASQ